MCAGWGVDTVDPLPGGRPLRRALGAARRCLPAALEKAEPLQAQLPASGADRGNPQKGAIRLRAAVAPLTA